MQVTGWLRGTVFWCCWQLPASVAFDTPATAGTPVERCASTASFGKQLPSATFRKARIGGLYRIGKLNARTGTTTIPIVVHVVHNEASPEQNISDEQIASQIDVLNKDYRSRNADRASTPGAFKPLIGDARIEFRFADKDPS